MRFPEIPPVVKNLLIINTIIFLAQAIFPELDHSLKKLLAIHYFSSPGFNVVQLFTYMFLHSNFTHLLFNMFALWMFGSIIEQVVGSARFLFYYISCGIFAALVQMGVYAIAISHYAAPLSPEEYHYIITNGWQALQNGQNFIDPTYAHINELVNGAMIGASGAIYGVILAYGMLFPRQPIYLFFIPVPIRAKWFVIGYGILELILGLSNSAADNVAHFAHLGGMIAGLIMIQYWKKHGLFNNRWFF